MIIELLKDELSTLKMTKEEMVEADIDEFNDAELLELLNTIVGFTHVQSKSVFEIANISDETFENCMTNETFIFYRINDGIVIKSTAFYIIALAGAFSSAFNELE